MLTKEAHGFLMSQWNGRKRGRRETRRALSYQKAGFGGKGHCPEQQWGRIGGGTGGVTGTGRGEDKPGTLDCLSLAGGGAGFQGAAYRAVEAGPGTRDCDG